MGNKGFYVEPGTPSGDIPDDICLKPKSKYPEKLLFWLMISEKGTNKLFFLVKKAALTGEIYREECISKYLVSFNEEYH